ncbi:MFS transporter [Sphingomonas glacialis]|uniref:MFS transporter n=1 Tax=Sphingomonas glacialis TaxID=658225 RepID=A0A502FW49_9SPHN|nr:MFS transporter [Sphingomonas glacialis]TPG53877.1 MFS transporter [Sphingomonas glacialis]
MTEDPRATIERAPMSRFQWIMVAVMIGLNALDGFDVLSISFASPGIAAEWRVDRAALGLVLSMELIGMALGSLLLGGVADRFGRRATILGCLCAMAAGMFGAATAHDVVSLSAWRVLTGLGIGGMLAATNAAVAEAANAKRRSLAVVLMAGGYPVGTIIGGLIATVLLGHYGWRAVFVFGGIATLSFIPLVLWRVPESIAFLLQRPGPTTLDRVNRTLARIGHPVISVLPAATPKPRRAGVVALFSRRHVALTAALTLAYLAHIMTFYYILKWIPKIVVDFGFPPPMAGGVLVWASVGGALGSLTLGLLTLRVRVYWLTLVAMLASTALVILFGYQRGSLGWLSLTAAIVGFATNAGVVGIYALLAQSYPTNLRASATGLVIGIGRGGSALAPALAGWLFAAGYGLPLVSALMGAGSLVAAVALFGARARFAALSRGIEPTGDVD